MPLSFISHSLYFLSELLSYMSFLSFILILNSPLFFLPFASKYYSPLTNVMPLYLISHLLYYLSVLLSYLSFPVFYSYSQLSHLFPVTHVVILYLISHNWYFRFYIL